ncbi:hypothetical protein [Caballeronia udeis]|uniref:hypothetical protein n=1 Tax=Caballeronia udeis TaxID=1232866 RepID=UPI0012E91E01|nr:hypothetical protein [Caballeronia udeis]
MKNLKTGPPRRNRHRQPWVSHKRYRENGTDRWGNLTGTLRFPGARSTKDMPGRAHRSPREKPAKKSAGKKTKASIHRTIPAQVTRRVVSKDLGHW